MGNPRRKRAGNRNDDPEAVFEPMMSPRLSPLTAACRRVPLRALAVLFAAGAGTAAAPAAAPTTAAARGATGDRILELGRGAVKTVNVRGSGLADAQPPAVTRVSARIAPKRSKRQAYNLTVVRKRINSTKAPQQVRYDARAALTSLDRVTRRSPARSQARREGEGALKVITQMARANRITAARLPIITATLNRNAEWWKQRKATRSGQRVQFDGSQMVWQLYAGSGLQLQWLGTFGHGNFLVGSGGDQARADLTALVDEALALAVPRAGGIAWEYMFPFGGGSPPWASGMAQATGIQVLSRAAAKLERPELLTAAKRALPLFEKEPPSGVASPDSTGTHFLIYSYARNQKVLNAMNQTVNGLYAYVLAAPTDLEARLLFLDGLTWLDKNLSRYDTGSWSRYQLGGGNASAHYHEVARGFLRTTCSLLGNDAKTPGGGPSGAYPPANICAMAERFANYQKKRAAKRR